MYHTGMLDVNTYYALDENTKKGFIVDPGGYDISLSGKIKEDGAAIEYILLTHGHSDHTGGVKAFQEDFPEAKVVAGALEKEMLADPVMNFSDYFGEEIVISPDIFVNDGDTLLLGELELKFFHTPGHSPGGICILVEDCLFSGDTIFRQSIGRTDFEGSSFKALEKSIKEKLYVLPDETKVYPGHMGETGIGFEKRNNPFVRY